MSESCSIQTSRHAGPQAPRVEVSPLVEGGRLGEDGTWEWCGLLCLRLWEDLGALSLRNLVSIVLLFQDVTYVSNF